MPPRAVRRVLTVPLLLLGELLLLLTGPLWLVLGGLLSLLTARGRPVRTVAAVLGYAACELAAVAELGWLLLRRSRPEGYDALVVRFLRRLEVVVRRTLAVRVRVVPPEVPLELQAWPGPLLVLARHAGPGDSFLLARLLTGRYRLRLRVVLSERLRWEPAIDLIGDHLPLAFVRPGGGALARIAEVTGGLGPGEGLLLFPEGANFSRRRRLAAIRRLNRAGERRLAVWALRRRQVLPPHPGGTAAALAAAPQAGVLLLAHSGLSADGEERPAWRLPVGCELLVAARLFPPEQVPRDPEGVASWLYGRWSEVDQQVRRWRAAGDRATARPSG